MAQICQKKWTSGNPLAPGVRRCGPNCSWGVRGLDGGFLSHGGTPSSHPFQIGIFHYKPSILGIPHLWNPPDDSNQLVFLLNMWYPYNPLIWTMIKLHYVHMKMATGCRKIMENPYGSQTLGRPSEASLKFHQKQCEKKRATRLGRRLRWMIWEV